MRRRGGYDLGACEDVRRVDVGKQVTLIGDGANVCGG